MSATRRHTVVAGVALLAACAGEPKPKLRPPAPWKHNKSTWDDAHWAASCGGEKTVTGAGIRWGTAVKTPDGEDLLEYTMCGATFRESGWPLMMTLEIEAPPSRIDQLLPSRVDLLCSEVPAQVCAATRMLATTADHGEHRRESVAGFMVDRTFELRVNGRRSLRIDVISR